MNGSDREQSELLYGFGPYRLDARERVLFRDGQPVPLTPKVIDVLILLVENRGHISEKGDLLSRVWPDSFVEESALAKNVSLLRKALGGEDNAYIETVARRGYRFVAAVTKLERTESETWPAPSPYLSIPRSPAAGAREPSRSRIARPLAGSVLLALAAAGYLGWQRLRPQSPEPGAGVPSAETGEAKAAVKAKLLVLPFENLSGDPAQEYLSDGLTEEMISQLSRVYPERLSVIARTSAMKYKGVRKGVTEIGRELDVDYILEGSVHREANRVRITSQLIRVSDQTHLWAETYDREVRGVLALQGEVARTIAGRIGIELTGEKRAVASAAPPSPEAYEDYLKGRFFWNKMTVEGFQKAIQHFEAALRRDPDYAEAYAGLADSYANLGLWDFPGKKRFGKRRARRKERSRFVSRSRKLTPLEPSLP